ncbi:hypothetical protein TNCT_30011, partial [Trichonephila clavata]
IYVTLRNAFMENANCWKSYRCRCDEGFSGSRCDEKIVADMSKQMTGLIGIFFCACRNRRLKNKVADQ